MNDVKRIKDNMKVKKYIDYFFFNKIFSKKQYKRVKIYFAPNSFIINFDLPFFLFFQLIGITLQDMFRAIIFKGNSKNTLKPSETMGLSLMIDFLL